MKCKKIVDARSYSHEALERMRIDAMRRVHEGGESPEVVASGLGINRRTIYRWIELYLYGGEEALKAKPIPGAPSKLSGKQLEKLTRVVREKNPLQLKFAYALWTLAIIREYIRREFDVSLSEVSVGRIMRGLGFSAQRPMYRAWQQDPVMVERWREEEYPKIAARAKRERALIFFADESGIRSDYHAGTTWAPKGSTPVIKATGARYGLNMLSAVNAQGHFRFMTVEGSVSASVFLEFIKRLITGMDRKVYLIVDGHPAHKAKMVTNFVRENAHAIELFYLPPYAPELNPDELAWGHIKSRIAKATTQTKEQLKKTVEHVMRSLQRTPEIVASFFGCPTCVYAKT